MSRVAYVNGRFVPHGEAAVHIEDRGYQFADGVYEVWAVLDGALGDAAGHFERLLILASDDLNETVTADLLPTDLGSGNGWGGQKGGDLVISLPLREAREIFERDYLVAQINRFGGNISRTAAFIGMERSALHRKLKSLGFGGARALEEVEGA